MARLIKALIGVAALLGVAACAVSDARRQHERQTLTRRIVDDAIAYNEAYSSAISGQILLNILRAHNRQPRQYMSMSGFANSDADARGSSFGVTGLPLGDLGQQWGQGAFGVNNSARLEPEYRVEPFGEDDYTSIARLPTSPIVFEHYWTTGWNRDLLLFLLVDELEITHRGDRVVLYNGPGTIAANCGDSYEAGGCAFVRAARDLAESTRGEPAPRPDGACVPIAVYGAVTVATEERPCPLRLVVGERSYTLTLRSLDAMVYYVGELIRRDDLHPPTEGALLEARLSVRAAGSRDAMTPLFRIVEADARSEREYAATVTFAGRRYSAGAPAADFCYRPGDTPACSGVRGDRSGSVLEFLAGILAYNQSDSAVRAPQNTIVR